MENKIIYIKSSIEDDDICKYLDNAIQKLSYLDDPTRYNSFAMVFREMLRKLLEVLSPDTAIKKCIWFELADKNKPNMITRAQRIQYAISSGLDTDFVLDELGFDLSEKIKFIKKPYADLNKYVHINDHSFNVEESIGNEFVEKCIDMLYELTSTIVKVRHSLKVRLEKYLYDYIFELFLDVTFDDLDILSTHTRVQGNDINGVSIAKIDFDDIDIEIFGSVDVELQYGSDGDQRRGDGLIVGDSYPFQIEKTIDVRNPLKFDIDENEVQFDTESYYE